MRAVKIATVVFLLLTLAVSANSLYIRHLTKEFCDELDRISVYDENASEELKAVAKKFKRAERFISVTVSHDDLTNIEEGFADLIGAAEAGMTGDVERIKNRLVDSIEHLGRLSGLNSDSII